jgi:hypothetical protein
LRNFSSFNTYSYTKAAAGASGGNAFYSRTGGTTNLTFTWAGASAGAQNSTGKTIFTFANAGGAGVPAEVTIDSTPLAFGKGNSMTGSVPVYVIYYTAVSNFYNWNTVGYFTTAKQQVIANFINGLTASTYFSTVRQYNRGGTPGNVHLAGSYVMDCNRDYWNQGCDLSTLNRNGTINADKIISSVIQTNMVGMGHCQKPRTSGNGGGAWCSGPSPTCFCGFAPSSNAIYVILMGPETTEAFSLKNETATFGSGAHMGEDYCAYHTYYQHSNTQYKYIVAQVPNSASLNVGGIMLSTWTKNPSSCFFGGANSLNSATSPNGDPQLDYVIGHLAHEIIETLVSPVARETYSDSNGNEVMDK